MKKIEEPKEIFFPAVIITASEYKKRKSVWNEYYSQANKTKAHERFVIQKEALRNGDLATVKRLAVEAENELVLGKNQIAKPLFPDPDIEKQYGRLGIKEWLEANTKPENWQALQGALTFQAD